MRYDVCDWDDAPGANLDHIAEHEVTPEEWQEVLDSAPRREVEPSETEPDYMTYLGETADGRTLRIVFELEETDDYVYVRPVTGFEPT